MSSVAVYAGSNLVRRDFSPGLGEGWGKGPFPTPLPRQRKVVGNEDAVGAALCVFVSVKRI